MTEGDRQQFGAMQEHIKTLDDTTRRIEAKLDAFIDKAESRFAPMWSAKLWIWLGAIVGTSVIGWTIKVLASHN